MDPKQRSAADRPSFETVEATQRWQVPHIERGNLKKRQRVTMKNMTRSDLIDALAARFPGLLAKDAEIAVREILDAVAQSLAQGRRVEIRGFGSFDLNYRPARAGRNPKSGEKVAIPAKYVPHFKPGKGMRERIDLSLEPVLLKRAA